MNRIIGVSGGLFTVETDKGVISAVSRGIFRKNGVKPVTGDYVDVQFREHEESLIIDIFKRKNLLIRPPLANLDAILLVVSACDPAPNVFVLDKLTAIFESENIETAFVFTKADAVCIDRLASLYGGIGYRVFVVNNITGDGAQNISDYIVGKTTALIGNTGVGKSSLFNLIVPNAEREIGETSKKLGRGRHTTRETILHRLDENTYIADTPGFSTVEVSRYVKILPLELASCFREFAPFLGKCRFQDCAHSKDEGCAVREAMESGLIARSRYESYLKLYKEASAAEQTY